MTRLNIPSLFYVTSIGLLFVGADLGNVVHGADTAAGTWETVERIGNNTDRKGK